MPCVSNLVSLRGSGEYALAYILAPGAFARSPLIHRVQGLGRQLIQTNTSALPHPTTAATAPSNVEDIPASTTAPPNPQPAQREKGHHLTVRLFAPGFERQLTPSIVLGLGKIGLLKQ